MRIVKYCSITPLQRRIYLFIIYFILNQVCAFSQGRWNINYISPDSLNTSFLGKEIRIDFKNSITDRLDKVPSVFDIRKFLSTVDTINLLVNDEPTKFKENWKLYIDHGVLQEQTLENIGNNKDTISIREIFLISIEKQTITLDIVIYNILNEKSRTKIIINKSDIKGVLY